MSILSTRDCFLHPLDFSFFLSYNEKETRKKGAEDVSIRKPEYRI